MRVSSIILAAVLFIGCAGDKTPAWVRDASKQQNKWGHYSGYVEARWENDGRSMTLLSELRYTDPDGVVWIAPAGSQVDGASIPRSLWTIMGGPFEGRYRNASVLHDVAYTQHTKPWPVCDQMFYNAMRCSGVNTVNAGTMYYSLRKFGHHWKAPKAEPVKVGDEIVARAESVNQGDINATRDWIRNSDPSLQQIDQRADAGSH